MKSLRLSGRQLVTVLTILVLVPQPGEADDRQKLSAVRATVRKAFDPGHWDNEDVHRELVHILHTSPQECVYEMLHYLSGPARELGRGHVAEAVLVKLCLPPHNEGILRIELIRHLDISRIRADLVERDQLTAKRIATQAYELLKFVDTIPLVRTPLQGPSLFHPKGEYIEILKSYGDDVPPSLIEYLFEQFPGRGLLWVHEAFAPAQLTNEDFERKLIQATHIIETTSWRMCNGLKTIAQQDIAMQQIDMLSKSELWYVRFYVVHILLGDRFFRTPELVKKLQNDPHPLVRERAKYIKIDD
ncbi:MAG: hypothetical protein RMJ19_13400 [Gemmatales bacterium]|nr:hypothetical protein [Gemmatales bacterium]MDW8176666.1 hypothetical protein [Gemmatales bacterium]